MAERKFDADKVYLQGPDGQIWPYDPHLSAVEGFKPVIPNKTKRPETQKASSDSDKSDNKQNQGNTTQ